jgi:hypothetical protein
MERWQKPLIVLAGLLLLGGALSAQPLPADQAKVDNSKILGTWLIDIETDGNSYHLTLVLGENAGKLEGKLSESMGLFKDLALADVVFDGQKLTFKFNSPTPPDGVTREVGAEFKLVESGLDGVINVPELMVTVPASGAREPQPKT